MAKRVAKRPEWLDAPVNDVYSVASCNSSDFADYINYWRHNGWWLFDSPEVITQLAEEEALDLSGTKLFYYEVYDLQCVAPGEWVPFSAETSFATHVQSPSEKQVEGFDVVSFCAGSSPECSPLSCNALASEVPVNMHCLLASDEDARAVVDSGALEHAEPGPYRIFAVYSVVGDWPSLRR